MRTVHISTPRRLWQPPPRMKNICSAFAATKKQGSIKRHLFQQFQARTLPPLKETDIYSIFSKFKRLANSSESSWASYSAACAKIYLNWVLKQLINSTYRRSIKLPQTLWAKNTPRTGVGVSHTYRPQCPHISLALTIRSMDQWFKSVQLLQYIRCSGHRFLSRWLEFGAEVKITAQIKIHSVCIIWIPTI